MRVLLDDTLLVYAVSVQCACYVRLMCFLPSWSDYLHYHRTILDICLLRLPCTHPPRFTASASGHGRRETPLERVCRRLHRTHNTGRVECVS